MRSIAPTAFRTGFALCLCGLLLCSALPPPVHAQSGTPATGGTPLTLTVDGGDGELGSSIKIVLLMTLLTLTPAVLMLMTSFTRILIVLGFLRQAIGTPQMPSNQILVGISLFLTFVVMTPVVEEINANAVQPYLAAQEIVNGEKVGGFSDRQAIEEAIKPVRRFMLAQTREKDLAMFLEFSGKPVPKDINSLPLSIVVPSFLTSELKTAFQMGFLLYVPFLIVDMVIASVLMSMGMMMLPPILISLPFKILLFVMVDGWHLITRSLVTAFAVTS